MSALKIESEKGSNLWAGRLLAAGLGIGCMSGFGVMPSLAQQSKPAPVQPAKPARVTPGSIQDQNAYPFQKALDDLNGRQSGGPSVPSVSAVRSQAAVNGAAGQVGNTSSSTRARTGGVHLARVAAEPPAPAPLSASAEKALMIANLAKADTALPEAGKDGRVTYTFGAGLPTIVCSPMHISILELQPGETMTNEPAIGDSVRWELMPGSSGKGANLQPLIILKPHMAGLDTNLVVTTDKRTYYLRLVSRDTEYMARTAFSYKDDEDAKWASFVAQEKAAKIEREDAQVVTPMAGDAISKLNFNYEIKGGNAVIRAIRVMDDGEKTYITMPDAVLHQDLPALVVVNPRLKGEKAQEIVNYRVKGNLYIVDRIFDRAALVIGSGKSVDKVEIHRRAAAERAVE